MVLRAERSRDSSPPGADFPIRRYEFYEYKGPYDDEHEPTSAFLDGGLLEPPAGELGHFLSSNMVGAVLVPIPEPATLTLLGIALGLGTLLVIHRRQ